VHVGQRLRRLRQARGLTQEQAAAAAGLTRNTLGSLERERFPDPHLSTLLTLMHVYQLGTLEELLGPLPSARVANAWEEEGRTGTRRGISSGSTRQQDGSPHE
jgi:transcriptional regulator with XRE-family HTH domain